MTAKRDLKRRVRQRQARTGESYVTARRRVMAARSPAGEPPDDEAQGDAEVDETTARIDRASNDGEVAAPPETAASTLQEASADVVAYEAATAEEGAPSKAAGQAGIAKESPEVRAARALGPATAAAVMEAIEISAAMRIARAQGAAIAEAPVAGGAAGGATVVELSEVTAEAALLGFRCRITLFPSVLESAELANVLLGLRNALVGAGGSAGKVRMFDVAFGLPSKPVPLIVRPYPPTTVLNFEVAGRAGPVEIACRLWDPASTLILRRADETGFEALGLIPAALRAVEEQRAADGPTVGLEREVLGQLARLTRVHPPPVPALYVVHESRHHRVTRDVFVIGRDGKSADLVLRDGVMSRKHAAVIYRNGTYYLKDLGSTNGVRYKGMLIDNKRIDEGDVFVIGEHELRFTYIENG